MNAAFITWAVHWEAVVRAKAVANRVIGKMRNQLLYFVFEGWLEFVELSQTEKEVKLAAWGGRGQAAILDTLNLRETTAAKVRGCASVGGTTAKQRPPSALSLCDHLVSAFFSRAACVDAITPVRPYPIAYLLPCCAAHTLQHAD